LVRLHSLPLGVALGLLVLAAPAPAQDIVALPPPSSGNSSANSTVGSPLLRDFDLDGTRTTPPAEAQPVQPAATTPQPNPQATAPRTQPAPRAAPPAAGPAVSAPTMSDYLAPQPRAPLPVPEATADVAVEPALPQPLPNTTTPLQPPGAQSGAWPAYYWAAPALLALLLGLFLLRRRRRTAEEPVLEAAPLARTAAPAPVRTAPIPAPAPADDDLRPWLELEFKPEKMVATASDATVHFDLTVKNVGRSAARNVRIQARMFNPSNSQQQDIKAFFATAMGSGAPMSVPPQLAAKFKSSVVMPRDKVREIEVQGRPLFIPTVAINILYEYGDGRIGQTSKSYVIGTEKQAAEKMGPFRLDLGPRIYRQVGGRPLDLARAV
jgi:MYXO-CTERM domain-containing protein